MESPRGIHGEYGMLVILVENNVAIKQAIVNPDENSITVKFSDGSATVYTAEELLALLH
jgi:hypothetical protein